MDKRIQYYTDYVNRLHEGNENELYFINNQLKKHLQGPENQTEIEHILDFLYSTKKSYKNIGYKTILAKTIAWDKKLQELSSKDNEIEGIDYEVVHDFNDGFKFVKLLSQSSYSREGNLMSHCVASYYGRDISIYSLRDANNKPHCTIEENNQVKGKGNQTVDNKYFAYCIKFLEKMGFSIGENEMKNIGFHKLDTIDEGLSVEDEYLYDGKYISEKNFDKIRDKDGEQYYGFGLLNIKSLFDFDLNMKIKFNFDIKKITSYFRKTIKKEDYAKVSAEDYAKVSAEDYAKVSAGNNAKVSAGNNATVSAGYNAKVSAGNNAKVSAEDYATVSAGYNAKVSAEDYAKVSAEDYATVSAGYNAKVSAEDYATVSAEDYATVSAGYNAKVSAEDYATVSAGNNAKVSAGMSCNIIVGRESEIFGCRNTILVGRHGTKAKGKIGAWIVLAEQDQNKNIIDMKLQKVDGIIIKEDVFYKLEGGELKEVK